MEVLAGTQVVLFRSEEDEEELCISGGVSPDGGLVIKQVSEGDLTAWCFEESPHEVRVEVGPAGTGALAQYFHVDSPRELLKMLGALYCGYDVSLRVRGLMQCLGVPYEVTERPIVR